MQYCSPRQFCFVSFELVSEPEGPSRASDSTTVLDRKPCCFTSHEYLFVSGHLSPTIKERLPALFHEYTPLDLYIHNCWLFRDIRKNRQIAAEWQNGLKRNGRSTKPGLTHSWIPLILLLSRQSVVQ